MKRRTRRRRQAVRQNILTVCLIAALCGGLLLYLHLFHGWLRPTVFEAVDLTPKAQDYYSPTLLLMDAESGQTLASKAADVRRAPASLTKMMTVLVALEQVADPSQSTDVDTDHYLAMVEADASMAGFYGGETVTVRDLMYGTMLPSGGEAAGSLAIAVSGSESAFADLMNRKAAEIGMTGSHFMNATGLDDPDQYSTADDLARLVRHAMQNPEFMKIFSAATYVSSATPNHPDGIYMESSVIQAQHRYPLMPAGCVIVAGKSGITDDAGRCWASVIEKQNRRYIAVTMGAPLDQEDPPAQLADTARLANWIPDRRRSRIA